MQPIPSLLLAALASPSLASAAQADGHGFAAVRAVIERNCLECHGGAKRESGLSFADGATFALGGARGAQVQADDPAASRLLRVIGYGDPSLAMPPSGPLAEADRALLEAWVLAGATWPEGAAGQLADPDAHPMERHGPAPSDPWWAYDPLVPPVVPEVLDQEWSRSSIDAFIGHRLDERGLRPAEQARPEALLRRATFDLTGLPPSSDDRARFLERVESDGFERAWSGLLDELFESPHYGEHQARQWLDLVRYGETNGYERDGAKRNVWRYRDWVVRAFDADLPYDRFAALQLAGDEIATELDDPAARAEALLATGFYRLGVWDDEPADPEQAFANEIADIVDTTSQVFMATTMGCARCHDHKADPISQREYYGLTATFAGLVSYGGGGYSQGQGPGATRDVRAPDAALLPTAAERDARVAELDAQLEQFAADFGLPSGGAGQVLVADARGAGAAWRYHFGSATEGWTNPAFDDSTWSEGPGGFGTVGTPGARVGTVWDSARIQLRTTFRLDAIPSALRLALHHDEDVTVFLNGQRVLHREGYRVDYGEFQLDDTALAALVVGRNVLALDCTQTAGGQYLDAGLDTGRDGDAEGATLAALENLLPQRADDGLARRCKLALDERAALLTAPVAEPFPAQVAYERGGEPPAQFVHLRGSVHAPGDEVGPGTPRAWSVGTRTGAGPLAFPEVSLEAESSGRRRALAGWLFDGGAHLAARVEANRLWQSVFGRGLCRTSGDFGRLGDLPTHPQLLDHLACELIARGWSRKSLQRYLMESRTYRMATVGPDASLAADPRNDLYWRYEPRRLTAEEFRDATLAVSGELEPERFGPSVFPPLPAEVLATASRPTEAWGQATPAQAARRSLYVHVKRSLREPLLAAHDQPDPDLPCPARFPTNVPTQALLTLNGEFVNGRAAALAEALIAATDDPRARLSLGIERALCRAPLDGEVERAEAFLVDLRDGYALDERRALELFALALMNRNEFLWLD
ncbi:PSD1 and planctomycete cytochrome C domain-containing protein [Engelhardtia mirabilis]|uniref:Planctomycete cytochrome C n=1 Tax=Engelhardtia mirabilis TaxID=2528011 RepID=A0A518BIT9_9BACT|nr:Planctomycete cytochrome C [Planctomycetes bacterium Pla133]QDV01211.1 Planctomycete cytochrome C [Planctomycetes bacterium Pla86]